MTDKIATHVRLAGRGKGWPHWTTPDDLLAPIRALGTIALDPCSNYASLTNAMVEFWGTDQMHFDMAKGAIEGPKKAQRITPRAARELERRRADAGIAATQQLSKHFTAATELGRKVKLCDGLVETWQGYVSTVYANPPYGPALPAWADKFCSEAEQGDARIIATVPARIGGRWAQQVLGHADAICFVAGRISFDNPPPGDDGDNPSGDVMVALWTKRRSGEREARLRQFEEAFASVGRVLRLQRTSFPVTSFPRRAT